MRKRQIYCLEGGVQGWTCHSGDNRDRTDDLMIANHTLYQLSYIPKLFHYYTGFADFNQEGEGRLLLLSVSGVSCTRSSLAANWMLRAVAMESNLIV